MTVWRQKSKRHQKSVIKGKLKFEDYKNCIEATQLKNKINHLEKNEIDVIDHKEFIRNNKLI